MAVPFSCRNHDSRIYVALNKRRFYKTPERTTVCFSSFVCSSLFIFIFVFPSSLLCFFCPLVLLLFCFLPSFLVFFACSFIFLSLTACFTLNFYHLNVSYTSLKPAEHFQSNFVYPLSCLGIDGLVTGSFVVIYDTSK